MFTRLGHLVVRRRRVVLVSSLVALVIAGVLGTGVFDRLSGGGFEDPDSESFRADELLETDFDAGRSNILLLVTADGGDVRSPEVAAEAAAVQATLAEIEGVTDVVSFWSLGEPPSLASDDGSRALILARVPGDEDTQEEVAGVVIEELTADGDVIEVAVGGELAVYDAIGSTIEGDLATAEAIAIPLTLLLLVIIFRGIVAALLPIAVGVAAIFGAFLVLFGVTAFTDVSIFSLNLVTALGLGLAIDYSLLIVSRYREELAAGLDPDQAVVRTVATAGRTVAFSALTVAVSLSALLLFPLYFLRSFAYAGVGVILVAMFASVITLPALLAALGTRVNKWSLGGRAQRSADSPFWGRVATSVMARPGVVTAAVVAVLLFVGLPFLNVNFGGADARSLPSDDETRITSEIIDTEFLSDEGAAFPVVATGIGGDTEAVESYAAAVSNVTDIARVDTVTGSYVDGIRVAEPDPTSARFDNGESVWLSVVPEFEPISSAGEARIAEIRDIDTSFDTLVAGATASLVDSKSAIFDLVPLAGLWIAVATFILLFLMFGSFLVPLKAIVLNSLSLTATFGAMVWIFQEGNGAGLLDFTATGLTDTTTPILMFCIAFGLSMDYEVFLLSRMKEEYDRTGDNDTAVAAGLAKTGGIVTAAALVLSVTFFAFATSGVTFIKLFGLGLAIAILADAFVVRATLVPALMKMAGGANWWAPVWARRIHDRFGLSEGESDPTGDDDGASREPAPVTV
ncbi:MAG: MMPL family transporter [Acidimicrobiales bacterium]